MELAALDCQKKIPIELESSWKNVLTTIVVLTCCFSGEQSLPFGLLVFCVFFSRVKYLKLTNMFFYQFNINLRILIAVNTNLENIMRKQILGFLTRPQGNKTFFSCSAQLRLKFKLLLVENSG